jgi:putative transposase
MTTTITRAVKVELRPTKKQAAALARTCGVVRYVYNYLLAARQVGYAEAKSRGEKYRIPYQYGLVSKHRDTDAPWIGDAPATSITYAIRGVDDAFKNWFASMKGQRAGRRIRAPRFKKKGKCRDSFCVQTQQKSPVSSRAVQIRAIGWIRTKEDATMRIPTGSRIVSATVSRDVDRWYASLCLQDVPAPVVQERPTSVIGVDLNVARAVCSDGTEYEVLKRLGILEKRLRRRQRVLARRKKGSNRRQVAKVAVAKTHRASRRLRADWLHKITTDLVHHHTRVVIEDLNVRGMTTSAKGTKESPGKNVRQKAGLNRVILRAGFFEFRRQLVYKAAWYGCEVIVADRWFASSKTCSCCGHVKQDLKLSDRIFHCDECGLTIDRDLNAARNLARYEAARQQVQPETTPDEVPAGSGELTDVERKPSGRSKWRKPESTEGTTATKRQRNTHLRPVRRRPSRKEDDDRTNDDLPRRRNRAGPSDLVGDA